MSEIASQPEINQKLETLKSSLESLNISFPSAPIESEGQTIKKPREWLLRGQSSFSVFTDPSMNYTLPWNSGELTRGGVFFADNFKPLALTPSIIVARTDEVHDHELSWLIRGSKEFELQVQQTAIELGLNVDSVGGYHDAALKVQSMFDTYETKSGITTLHAPLPLDRASYIILSKGTLSDAQIEQMPQELQEKIHWM